MTSVEPRTGAAQRRFAERPPRARAVDAEIFAPPRIWLLMLLSVIAVLAQATVLHGLALRGAHVSLLTVLVVWTGLRCGVSSGGWLGLFGGLLEDALGGAGANVLSGALVGYAAGLLSNRFFSDSLPVFVFAVAAATGVRGVVSYIILDIAFGERGMFVRILHTLVWQSLLNCLAAAIVLLWLRSRTNVPQAAR